MRTRQPRQDQLRGVWTNDRAPKLDIVPTPYGVYYTALRHINDQGDIHHRVNQYLYPLLQHDHY